MALGDLVTTWETSVGNDLADYTVNTRTLAISPASGNTVVVYVSIAGLQTITPPAGYVEVPTFGHAEGVSTGIYTKISDGLDVDVTVSWGSNVYFQLVVQELEGALDLHDAEIDASGMPFASPAVTSKVCPSASLDAGAGHAISFLTASNGNFLAAGVDSGFALTFNQLHDGGNSRPFIKIASKAITGPTSEAATFATASGNSRPAVATIIFKESDVIIVPPEDLVVSLSHYSGDNTLGTVGNPACSPFGAHFLANVTGYTADELMSDSFGALWDYSDDRMTTFGERARIAGGPVSASRYTGLLLDSHVFVVPDGTGVQAFTVRVGVKRIDGKEGFAEHTVYVQDPATYYGPANTICVSTTLALNEAAFVAAGAPAGATYTDSIPGNLHNKRVLFYGPDTFTENLRIQLGQHNWSIDSFGAGTPEFTNEVRRAVSPGGDNSLGWGGASINDSDIVNGWCDNVRIENIRAPIITMGAGINHATLLNVDADYSALTTPNREAGQIVIGESFSATQSASPSLHAHNVPVSSGLYIDECRVAGTSLMTLCESAKSTSGNIIDLMGLAGTTLNTITHNSTAYTAGQSIVVGSEGTLVFQSNGDYSWTTSGSYNNDSHIPLLVTTDSDSATLWTGGLRPLLNIGGIYGHIFGLSITNSEFKNCNEHNLRIMGAALQIYRDLQGGNSHEQNAKHFLTVRCINTGNNTNVPAEFIPAGAVLPFGSDGIVNYGGSAYVDYQPDTILPVMPAGFAAVSHIQADLNNCFSGEPAACFSVLTQTGVTSTNQPTHYMRWGMRGVMIYDGYVDTEDANNPHIITGSGDGGRQAMSYVKLTQTDPNAGTITGVVYAGGENINAAGDLPFPAAFPDAVEKPVEVTPLSDVSTEVDSAITPIDVTTGITDGTATALVYTVVGSLPAGLTLSSGVISGTPTAVGVSNVIIRVTNGDGGFINRASFELDVTAVVVVNPVEVTPLSNVSTLVDQAITPIDALAGVTDETGTALTASIIGTPPVWLSITDNVIAGTPAVAGATVVTVQIANEEGGTLTRAPFTINAINYVAPETGGIGKKRVFYRRNGKVVSYWKHTPSYE